VCSITIEKIKAKLSFKYINSKIEYNEIKKNRIIKKNKNNFRIKLAAI